MKSNYCKLITGLITIFIMSINFCSCEKIKHDYFHFYSVSWDYNEATGHNEINITMHYPSVGMVGINEIYWGDDGNDPDDVEKDIYDEINPAWYNSILRNEYNKKTGVWFLFLTLKEKDQYGNWVDGATKIPIGSLDCDEVRRYVDYSYFKGTITNMIIDGWHKGTHIINIP